MIRRLIGIKLRSVAGMVRSEKTSSLRGPLFLVLSLIFWAGLYSGSLWVVRQSLDIQPVGELLVQRLLSITFLVFLALLVFSNIVTAFTTFYLSEDLQFLMAKPIETDDLVGSRFVESLAQSSWIVVLFGLPIFIATGVGLGAGLEYYTGLIGVLIPFVALPTALAAIISLAVTNILSASRTRDAMFLFGVLAFAGLFVAVRALRPERLLNPDSFESVSEMLDLLSTPSSAYLPSQWCMDVLTPLLFGSGSPDWWSLGMLYLTPVAAYVVMIWLHRGYYRRGFSKAQEGRNGPSILTRWRNWIREHSRQWRGSLDDQLASLRNKGSQTLSSLRHLVRKDQRIFLRDASQWSQLLVVVAIIIIYLVNYKYFEIAADEKLFGEVGLYYFNMTACGFVVVAVGGRFLFPAVSLEGRNFWQMLQAPISLETFLTGKWLGGMAPVVLIGQALIWSSNLLVGESLFESMTAALIMLDISAGVAAVAVGLGAVYPQFHNPNAAKIASSFGAVIYMILSMFMVLGVLAGTFHFNLHLVSLMQGEGGWGLEWPFYLVATVSLVIPVIAGWAAIRTGAWALRQRR